jgi:hypothetical protein
MQVLNKTAGSTVALEAVYVGRPTQWGNPFVIGKHGDRVEIVARFRAYAEKRLQAEPEWLKPLVGKDLVCWCAPQRCHAEVLIQLANK